VSLIEQGGLFIKNSFDPVWQKKKKKKNFEVQLKLSKIKIKLLLLPLLYEFCLPHKP